MKNKKNFHICTLIIVNRLTNFLKFSLNSQQQIWCASCGIFHFCIRTLYVGLCERKSTICACFCEWTRGLVRCAAHWYDFNTQSQRKNALRWLHRWFFWCSLFIVLIILHVITSTRKIMLSLLLQLHGYDTWQYNTRGTTRAEAHALWLSDWYHTSEKRLTTIKATHMYFDTSEELI